MWNKQSKMVIAAALLLSPAPSIAGDLDCSGADVGFFAWLAGEMRPQPTTQPVSTATGHFALSYHSLQALGYVEAFDGKPADLFGDSVWEDHGVVWTGRNGIYSRQEFIDRMDVQICAAAELTQIIGVGRHARHVKK